jgi:hypothetical protein
MIEPQGLFLPCPFALPPPAPPPAPLLLLPCRHDNNVSEREAEKFVARGPIVCLIPAKGICAR